MNELEQRISLVSEESSEMFLDLVGAAGLDPATDFRYFDFAGMDLSYCKLSGFDFTGSDLSRATLNHTDFEGAVLVGTKLPRGSNLISKQRERIISVIEESLDKKLIGRGSALFETDDGKHRIVCTISKRYIDRDPYWYAYHLKWDDFLKYSEYGVLVLGCLDEDRAFAIPREIVYEILGGLHKSESSGRIYWHVSVRGFAEHFEIVVPRMNSLSIDQYQFSLHSPTGEDDGLIKGEESDWILRRSNERIMWLTDIRKKIERR